MRQHTLDCQSKRCVEVSLRVFLATMLLSSPVVPATITVDEVTCTLVDAIEAANDDMSVGGCTAGDPGEDTIRLTVDVLLTEPSSNYFGPTGLPIVRSDILIDGSGREIEASQPNSCADGTCFRVIAVALGADDTVLTLRNTTVSGGEIGLGDGGGILVGVGASLLLIDSAVVDNDYGFLNDPARGGGIFASVDSTIVVENSQINRNRGGAEGGGIFLSPGSSLVMEESTLSFNSVNEDIRNGGGLFADAGSNAVISNSSIVGNTAEFSNGGASGGGIFFQGETLTLRSTTIFDNLAYTGAGGGIYIGPESTVVVRDSTISGNAADGGYYGNFGGGGGGISVTGELNMTDSTVSDNVEDRGFGGGGIRAFGAARVTLTNTTFAGNRTTGVPELGRRRGGGLLAEEAADITLINSTLSNNYANVDGGAVHVRDSARVTLLYSTLVDNVAKQGGSNIRSAVGPTGARVLGSVIVGGDCLGTVSDADNNFTDSRGCPGAPIVGGIDIDSTLADNGGPTQTHALLPGSVAIDGGTDCPLETDQRGFSRGDGFCDSGSFEFGALPFRLSGSGKCPGVVFFEVAGASPGGGVRLYKSTAEGQFTLPTGGLCEGVEIGLQDPESVTTKVADAKGERSFSRDVTKGVCGLYLQAIDAKTCAVTEVVQIPSL